jgi:hypothetical protein
MIRIPQVRVDPMIPAGPIVRRGTIGSPADLPALPIEAERIRPQVRVAVIRVPVIVPAVMHLARRKETTGRPTVEVIGRIGMRREPIVRAAT